MSEDSDEKNTNCITPSGDGTAKKLHWLEWAIGFLQLGLFVVGVWALVIYNGQWKAMKDADKTESVLNSPAIGPSSLQQFLLPDKTYLFQQSWANSGHTPGRNIKVDWTWQTEEPTSYSSITFKKHLDWDFAISNGLRDDMPISVEDQARIVEAKHIFFLGKITYGDYLPDSETRKLHLVRYCVEAIGVEKDKDMLKWPVAAEEFCPHLNCSDENCPNY